MRSRRRSSSLLGASSVASLVCSRLSLVAADDLAARTIGGRNRSAAPRSRRKCGPTPLRAASCSLAGSQQRSGCRTHDRLVRRHQWSNLRRTRRGHRTDTERRACVPHPKRSHRPRGTPHRIVVVHNPDRSDYTGVGTGPVSQLRMLPARGSPRRVGSHEADGHRVRAAAGRPKGHRACKRARRRIVAPRRRCIARPTD